MIRMAAGGGLTRYVFPTGPTPSPANALALDWLVPPQNRDLVRSLFELFWTHKPRSLAEAQQWVDRHWNVAGTPRIEIDGEGSWFGQLSSGLGPIFDHYSTLLRDRFAEPNDP